MARSIPVAYILDRKVFESINASLDYFIQTSQPSIKQLDQKFDEQMSRLEEMAKQLEAIIESYQKQIEELQKELSDIKRQNFNNSTEGGYIDTSGIESQIQELKTIKHRVMDNLSMINSIISKMSDEMYEYHQQAKRFDELLEKDLLDVKKQLQTLDTMVEDYSTKKIQL